MTTVVSSQGFFARLATPSAGLIFGFLLPRDFGTWHALALGIFVVGGAIGISRTYRAYLVDKSQVDESILAS
jgi:hypothetical protein